MFQFGMSNHKVEALRSVPMFAGHSDKQLSQMAGRMDEIEVAAGTVLTHEGRPGHSFYVLLAGEVDVFIDGARRAKLGTGAFFGEVSMLDRGPATATVVAADQSRLMVMSHSQFRDAVKANKEVSDKVTAAMTERLQANQVAGYESRRTGHGLT